VAGELKPKIKRSNLINYSGASWCEDISLELFQSYATATGDEVSTCPKDGFVVKFTQRFNNKISSA
jgi:hypothetical protein